MTLEARTLRTAGSRWVKTDAAAVSTTEGQSAPASDGCSMHAASPAASSALHEQQQRAWSGWPEHLCTVRMQALQCDS
jgi:hypothetical protein